jgi:hypothetical protein
VSPRGCPIRALHIPESLGSESGGQLSVRDRGNGLKTQPVVYRWTNGAGWVNPTSYEVMKMKAVNHKPMIRPKGTLAFRAGRRSVYLNLSLNYINFTAYRKLLTTAFSSPWLRYIFYILS